MTWNGIHDLVNLTFDFLGAETIILQTVQLMNNVASLNQTRDANTQIWQYAKEFNKNQTLLEMQQQQQNTTHGNETIIVPGKRKRIIVMDMYAYTMHMFLQSSMAIGLMDETRGNTIQQLMDESKDQYQFINSTTLMEDLMNYTIPVPQFNVFMKIGQVYADKEGSGVKNGLSHDGMHACTDTVGGRINAATACLLQCRYGGDTAVVKDDHYDLNSLQKLDECERRCNLQYMSLVPIPWNGDDDLDTAGVVVDDNFSYEWSIADWISNTSIAHHINSTKMIDNY